VRGGGCAPGGIATPAPVSARELGRPETLWLPETL